MPDVQKAMIDGGSEPQSSTPDEFMARIRADVAKFSKVVKDPGIKTQGRKARSLSRSDEIPAIPDT